MTEPRKKILCIEDDRETAAVILEELADRGFAGIVAYDGQAGLLSIIEDRPDLVLCDINLPVMSGFEVLARLTEIAPQCGQVPFLFLTALADRDSELKGLQLGADDYITKPIDFDRLALIINARLAGIARTQNLAGRVKLNDHEIEVLTLVARGKTSVEVAKMTGLSKRTVDFHIDNARGKLNAETRSEAAVKALAAGLIRL